MWNVTKKEILKTAVALTATALEKAFVVIALSIIGKTKNSPDACSRLKQKKLTTEASAPLSKSGVKN